MTIKQMSCVQKLHVISYEKNREDFSVFFGTTNATDN